MKRTLNAIFHLSGYASGRKLFLHNSIILLLFFRLCRLYQAGFWVCLLAFVLGQLFLGFAEFLYCLLMWWFRLIREVFSSNETHKDSV